MNEWNESQMEMSSSAEKAEGMENVPALEEMIRQAVAAALAEEHKAMEKAVSPEAALHNELAEKEAALEEREQALKEREMRSFAREQLANRKLPEVLLDALCCRDEESCLNSLEQVEKAFRTAVQEGVVERMRGKEPLRSDAAPLDTLDDDAYYHATYVK